MFHTKSHRPFLDSFWFPSTSFLRGPPKNSLRLSSWFPFKATNRQTGTEPENAHRPVTHLDNTPPGRVVSLVFLVEVSPSGCLGPHTGGSFGCRPLGFFFAWTHQGIATQRQELGGVQRHQLPPGCRVSGAAQRSGRGSWGCAASPFGAGEGGFQGSPKRVSVFFCFSLEGQFQIGLCLKSVVRKNPHFPWFGVRNNHWMFGLVSNQRFRVRKRRNKAGSEVILSDINLQIPAGATVAVMGPSGCGKSSITNVLSGRAGYAKAALFGPEVGVSNWGLRT